MLKSQTQIMFFLDNSSVKKEYLLLFTYLIFVIVLTLFIMGASYFLAKQNPEVEKLSAYECGFEPYEDSRHTFDVNVFVKGIV